MFQIEKNIPMPAPRFGPGASKYPFASMAVGDSFAVPLGESSEKTIRTITAATANFRRSNKGANSKFAVRTDKQAGVVRVWRTS